MILVYFCLIQVVTARLSCSSPNSSSLFPFHVVARPMDHVVIRCEADSIIRNRFGIYNRTNFTHNYDVPSMSDDVHPVRCWTNNENCTVYIIIDYNPYQNYTHMTLQAPPPGQPLVIRSPFKTNIQLPRRYHMRLINGRQQIDTNVTSDSFRVNGLEGGEKLHIYLLDWNTNKHVKEAYVDIQARALKSAYVQQKHKDGNSVFFIISYLVIIIMIECVRLYK
jgi:hypothetical protein